MGGGNRKRHLGIRARKNMGLWVGKGATRANEHIEEGRFRIGDILELRVVVLQPGLDSGK